MLNLDPMKWTTLKPLLVVPDWLGGARTVRYIMTHKWCHYVVLWPLIKLRGAFSMDQRVKFEQWMAKAHPGAGLARDPEGDYYDEYTRGAWAALEWMAFACPFCGCLERLTDWNGSCRKCGAPDDLWKKAVLVEPWAAVSAHLRNTIGRT